MASKHACNVRFLHDMQDVCRRAYPETLCPVDRIGLLNCPQWRYEKSACHAWAVIYYDAVFYDTLRYLLPGAYASWPYGGYFTPCEDCPTVPGYEFEERSDESRIEREDRVRRAPAGGTRRR